MRDERFYKNGRLKLTARKMAVALIETGSIGGCSVRREVGCTWNGGNPVYQTEKGEYAVGSKKTVPDDAIKIEGTPLWVRRCR